MVQICNLVTQTNFLIAKTVELILFVKTSVENSMITKDCPELLQKHLHPVGQDRKIKQHLSEGRKVLIN